MTTKSDWDAVRQDMTAEQRRKPGEPPAIEEMLAYSRGELSGEDAQRVQAWLAANPEMAQALTQPFPEDDARPGDDGYLSQEEVSRRWSALRKEIRPGGRVVRFPAMTALAAAAALIFAGLYFYEVQQSRMPSLGAIEQELEPAGRRRGAIGDPPMIDVTQRVNTLALKLTSPKRDAWYEIQIWKASGDPARPVWTSQPTQAEDGKLEMNLTNRSLRPGLYRIHALRLDEQKERELVDEYLVRVPAR